MADFLLRAARPEDCDFVTMMLVEAANWHPARKVSPHKVLGSPATRHYVAGWPQQDDLGVIAEERDGKRIGAAWLRYFSAEDPGYGFVGESVPELSMAVVAERRGRGVGRALLTELLAMAARHCIPKVSLSVERANFAIELYRSVGFTTVASGDDADTMVAEPRA